MISALTNAFKKKELNKTGISLPIDQKVRKLEDDMKKLTYQFENTVKNELLKRVARLEQDEKQSSQKISNLEKNALIVTDF